MENETENLDSINEEQETLDSSNEQVDATNEDEQKEEYTPREKQYYARIKKLEEELKEAKTPRSPKAEMGSTLSTQDVLALSRANIHDEDIDEVVEYASLKKIPLAQALKSDVIQATLALREEKRKSAQATHVGKARTSKSTNSDAQLLSLASKGELPDSDEDIARLTELRLKQRSR